MGLFDPISEEEKARLSADMKKRREDEDPAVLVQRGLNAIHPGLGDAPAPTAPITQADIETAPGGQPSSEFSDQENANQMAADQARQQVFTRIPRGPGGPGTEVMPEGLDYLKVGPDGKSDFQKAFVEGPKNVGEALDEGERAETEKNKALQTHYANEQARQTSAAAQIEARRQEGDHMLQQKQEQLDQHLTAYTNNLADENRFWRNPGNIVSAIAFSLMPVFSRDPEIGIKYINQAIDRDMNDRKRLADMHMGELRSNLGEYRKLAGDQRVGDLLAESEAKRIAAMEIDRIGANFASPISQAKKEVLKQNFLMQSMQAKMQAYQAYHIYNDVKAVQPGVAAAYKAPGKAGIEGAWSPFGGGNVAGQINGTPTVAAPVALPPGMDRAKATALASRPDVAVDMGAKGQLDPKSLEAIYQAAVAQDVYSRTPGQPGTDAFAVKYNEKVREREAQAQKSVKDIAVAAQPFQDGMILSKRILGDMSMIENAARQRGEDPNKFLGDLRNTTSYAARINDLRLRYGSADTPEAQVQKDALQASERFHRLLSADIMDYKHGLLGGAQSEQELEGFKQIVNYADSWQNLKNFAVTRNQQFAAKKANSLRSSEDPIAALLYLRSTKNYGATLDTHVPPPPKGK